MTWAEFRIRLYAYQRQQTNKEYELRRLCYQIYVSNYYGKGKPKNIDSFWNIKSSQSYDRRMQRIETLRKARENYIKQKNG